MQNIVSFIGPFNKRDLWETYNCMEPTNRIHPISMFWFICVCTHNYRCVNAGEIAECAKHLDSCWIYYICVLMYTCIYIHLLVCKCMRICWVCRATWFMLNRLYLCFDLCQWIHTPMVCKCMRICWACRASCYILNKSYLCFDLNIQIHL